jgi:16S rRNA (uracil1498-N3)-methyltransferase
VAGGPGGPGGEHPDPVLVAARAMVFVDDPSHPVLTRDDAHHLLDVLRLRPGESVVAGDGAGSWVPCQVAGPAGGRGSVELGAVLVADGEPTLTDRVAPAVTVAFVPAKGDRPEWVVQKLTELGVDRIVPVRSDRSVVRWEHDRADRATERLRRVAREASAQCRRPWLPEVGDVVTLDALTSPSEPAPVLAHPGGGPPSLDHPVLVVGPEGGWTDQELAASGGTVGLGPTVLRAETAAVVAGAILCGIRNGLIGPLRNHAP